MTPERIQLRRTKGWRKPDNTVVVARPAKWGNLYAPIMETGTGVWRIVSHLPAGGLVLLGGNEYPSKAAAIEGVVGKYRTLILRAADDVDMFLADYLGELTGKNLACWCPLDQPCHADVLLELANGVAP